MIIGTGNPYDGMVIPGTGWPSDACGHGVVAACGSAVQQPVPRYPAYYSRTYAQFQPRLGVAYSLNDKTVIRSGNRPISDAVRLWDNIFPGANSPFQPFVTVTNVSVDNPGARSATRAGGHYGHDSPAQPETSRRGTGTSRSSGSCRGNRFSKWPMSGIAG